MNTRFEHKVALVTGASQGIGRGIAARLAAEGADLALNYYPREGKEGIEATRRLVEEHGKRPFIAPADVSHVDEIEGLVADVRQRFGRIDILVNNAGITLWKPLLQVDEELWDRQLDTNLKSQFFLAQAAARSMIDQGGGRIVNIGSVLGWGAQEAVIPYQASKGGVAALTRGLALELGRHGITVNAVAPGPIEVARTLRDDPQYAAHWTPILPVGRVGQSEDIAAAVAFLASDEASFITGQVLYVDGGLTAVLARPGQGSG